MVLSILLAAHNPQVKRERGTGEERREKEARWKPGK
jgi:hypothetical protein